eukprot:3824250-Prymnesium_polylepis.1
MSPIAYGRFVWSRAVTKSRHTARRGGPSRGRRSHLHCVKRLGKSHSLAAREHGPVRCRPGALPCEIT